jgi:hypothetical protein
VFIERDGIQGVNDLSEEPPVEMIAMYWVKMLRKYCQDIDEKRRNAV